MLVAVGGALYAARSSGYLGFGLAHLWAQIMPRDEAILSYLPLDERAFLLVSPHHLEPRAFDPQGRPPAPLERLRADVRQVAGVDLALDVDRLALSPGLAVARGRFDRSGLGQRLARAGYRQDEYRGVPRWVKADEDAVALDDGTLLYGGEGALKAALDAHLDEGRSLASRPDIVARLDRAGWSHAFVAYVDGSQTTSLRAALLGSTGPRGLVAALDTTQAGVELHGLVEAPSPEATDELFSLLESKRRGLERAAAGLGGASGPLLEKAVAAAVLRKGGEPASVEAHARLGAAEVATLLREASGATERLREAYQALRLVQLLSP
ncbi:MAG TPA: hypothetical protein VFS43_20145 [Polyangiaceae bacterium]|nr:hypothetical protein [Polyangiaceae bacterium]